jgi:hypothetical protein
VDRDNNIIEASVKRKSAKFSFRGRMSNIKDTARKWNKDVFTLFTRKKLVPAHPIDVNESAKLRVLHIVGLILGNLLVLALFILLYVLF